MLLGHRGRAGRLCSLAARVAAPYQRVRMMRACLRLTSLAWQCAWWAEAATLTSSLSPLVADKCQGCLPAYLAGQSERQVSSWSNRWLCSHGLPACLSKQLGQLAGEGAGSEITVAYLSSLCPSPAAARGLCTGCHQCESCPCL